MPTSMIICGFTSLVRNARNAPINVKPHYPPPGLTRGVGGDLTFRKIKYSTHRGKTGGQISVYCGWNAL